MSFSLNFDHAAIMTWVTSFWGMIDVGGIPSKLINLFCVILIFNTFRKLGRDIAADEEEAELDVSGGMPDGASTEDLFPWEKDPNFPRVR
jgi:hypothetical protein